MKCSHVSAEPWPRYFSVVVVVVGTWMNSPSLRCDLNKPLGLGLAEGENDAIFTLSSQILSEFDDGANSSTANLIFVINVLADGEGWA